jgi:hypothetical protein
VCIQRLVALSPTPGSACAGVRALLKGRRRLGHADHRDAELGACMRTQPGPTARSRSAYLSSTRQPQPAGAVQDGAQRRQLPPVELARLVPGHFGHHRDMPGQHLREQSIGGHHGCRPGVTRSEVVHLNGHAQAVNGMLAGAHAMRMPRPTGLWNQLPAICHTQRPSLCHGA